MMRGHPDSLRGFGILEAIVALTLLAGTGAALYAWLGTNLRSASALSEAMIRSELQLRALELLETVNPAKQAQGALTVGQLKLQWRSQETTPSRYSMPYAQEINWRVALYRTKVTAQDLQSKTSVHFEVTQAGVADASAAQAPASSPAP
ncbi:hypothetical protein [Roseateles sp.]|uniref:hypothetical protein n=1 Tax=Roseateles sp. TaxID=1971397 RepID=UPI003BAD17B7